MRAAVPVIALAAPAGSRATASDLIALVKLRYHITFVNVIFGALIFSPSPRPALVAQLAALYVSFNLLMYGGIYTMNDVSDRHSDRCHPQKRHRPIASRRVGVAAGIAFAAAMIGAGLAAALALFAPAVVACHLAALGLNVAYSFGGRNILYLDLLLNSAPHVVRFLMGVLLVGRVPDAGHLLGVFLLAMVFSCRRRQVERSRDGWETRPTLSLYGRRELAMIAATSVAALIVTAGLAARSAPGYWGILLASALVLAGGAYASPAVRGVFASLWLR
jgi:4-hydroxybenzoate polyprenyltransferase